MSLSRHLTLISAVFLLSAISATALNITHVLEKYPDFSNFNSLLSSTGLTSEINRRKTITVLALTNSNLGELNGKSQDIQKRILSTHIILDYYDTLKLSKLKDKSTVTTLYQTTGIADGRQGFLSVTHQNGKVVFGSAMKGSPQNSQLLGSVMSQPYNVSILSVSQPIVANGIDGVMRPMPAPAPKSAAAAPSEDLAPDAEAPIDEADADAPTAADSPAPTEADAPADSPAAADGPATDTPAADVATPPSGATAGKQMISGVSLGLVALVSFLAAH